MISYDDGGGGGGDDAVCQCQLNYAIRGNCCYCLYYAICCTRVATAVEGGALAVVLCPPRNRRY